MRGLLPMLRSLLLKKQDDKLESPDFESELEFWSTYLAARPDGISNAAYRESAFPAQLLPYLHDMRSRGGNIKLLEVGAGPVSLLSWGAEQCLFEMTAIDPLADAYARILADNHISYPVKPVSGSGEKLLDIFAERSFDVVYSSNALDHAISPHQSLQNISRVVKEGGLVCLEGFCREGTNAGWEGLHQHDLVPQNGQLLHFNRQGHCTNLTGTLDFKCLSQKIGPFSDRGIQSFGYEPGENGFICGWYYFDWYTMIFRAQPSPWNNRRSEPASS